jgi:hypothetical protein
MYKMQRCLLVVSLALMAASPVFSRTIEEVHGFEPHFVAPPDAGIVSIKDLGAVGDGVTDDTAAFRKAIGGEQHRTIYIPNGTYLIRDQLRYGVDGSKKKRVLLIGESRSKSILKLADNSPGFGDASAPKPFIWSRHPKQQGEQNMHQYIYHLTIEIGRGNPGAIGLNYHSNNTGAVKDVTIRATDPVGGRGHTGLACLDWEVGPANARYITIEGFATGAALTKIGNYFTMEHVTVRNCGVGVVTNAASIRGLRTENVDLAIKNNQQLVLTDSQLAGRGAAAIENAAKASLLASGVEAKGFGSLLAGAAAGKTVLVGSVRSNWKPDGEAAPLALPVEDSPEIQYPQSAAEWVVLPASDITQALQAGIDAGKQHFFVQAGSSVSKTIHLRNKVCRIMGAGVMILAQKTGDDPAFRVEESDSTQPVIIELLYIDYGYRGKGFFVEQAAPRTVVFRHGSGGYRSLPSARGGRVFLESIVGHPFIFEGVYAWVRDLDTEQGGADHTNVINKGSLLWILGHKTEDFATKIRTEAGGFTELLGGTYRQNWDASDFTREGINEAKAPPLFEVIDSQVSLTYSAWGPGKPYEVLVRETRGAETRSLQRKDAGGGAILFVGYSARPAAPDSAAK